MYEISTCNVLIVFYFVRSCYDLEQHSKKTGVPMFASCRLNEPVFVDKVVVEANKKLLGPRFKNDQKTVLSMLESLDGVELEEFKSAIESNGTAVVNGKRHV